MRSTLMRCLALQAVSVLVLLLSVGSALAQQNVRGWYAKGQVWIVWAETGAAPETYEIYKGTTPFTDTSQATLAGRFFKGDWEGERLKLNGASLEFTIPNGSGGVYTLTSSEGLFVDTPHASGSLYYAVVKTGSTVVTSTNRTASAVSFNYDPIDDPVEAHLQTSGANSGWPFYTYCMWIDGRDDYNDNRPDFAVMANRHRNGIPHIFQIVTPQAGVPPGLIPATLLLHGGGGDYTNWGPWSAEKQRININPVDGIIVAHDDALIRKRQGGVDTDHTWWFGWGAGYNPFIAPSPAGTTPPETETMVNYTMRRLEWINDWLIRRWNVDSNRLSIMGHSMGSAGTTINARAFPNRYSTATVFCNGFEGPESAKAIELLGSQSQDLATTLVDYDGQIVRTRSLWKLSTNIAPQRDMPLIRVFNGKDDTSSAMAWSGFVTNEYRAADDAGWGMHLYWDDRGHGLTTWDSQWSSGTLASQQTGRDDVAYQSRYRSNQSFPGFFNHDENSGAAGQQPDPGNGSPSSGDPWGTWGGYYDWELDMLTDTENEWACTVFLIGAAPTNPVGVYPGTTATSDIAIRKPQNFNPAPGTMLSWSFTRVSDNAVLQSGAATVAANGLIIIPGLTIYKDSTRCRLKVIPQGGNQTPVANNQSGTAAEDGSLAISLSYSDSDGPGPYTFTIVSGPGNGALSGSGQNRTYTPNPNYNGSDSFTWKVNDGLADSNIATFSITVTAVNDPPIFASDPINKTDATAGQAYTGQTLAGSATDVDNNPLTYSKVSGPAWLSVASDGTLSGTPGAGDAGLNGWVVQVSDGQGGADQATLNITVAVGPAPLFSDGFETDFSKWTDGGTTDWIRTTGQFHSGSYSARAGSAANDLISDNINTTGYSSITITFWYRDDSVDDADDVYLQLYNGTSYVNRLELGNTNPERTWHQATVTINNSGADAVYFRSNFRIKFEGASIDLLENLWIDDVAITATGGGGGSFTSIERQVQSRMRLRKETRRNLTGRMRR